MFASSSLGEVLAILRAILAAKFHDQPDDLDVPQSASLAEVAVRLREAARKEEVRREGQAAEERWREWLSIGPERREWRAARAYAISRWKAIWPRWSPDERRAAAVTLLSPYEPGEQGLAQFLAEVEAGLRKP
jgi:hypothetical protein